jgi:hypothetical protein
MNVTVAPHLAKFKFPWHKYLELFSKVGNPRYGLSFMLIVKLAKYIILFKFTNKPYEEIFIDPKFNMEGIVCNAT